MKDYTVPRKAARAFAAVAVFAALNGEAMAAYDFDKAWAEVSALSGKDLPRSVTNKVEEISREAVGAARWPDAVRAFLVREKAMERFTDAPPQDWLPAFAASVDAQPAPMQAVLQLHLAHTFAENSRRWRWGGAAPTKLDDEAAADRMPPWSPEKIAATLESQFAKVFAHEAELKAQKLFDWKTVFSTGGVPERYCPTLFDFAVRDAIEFYGETIPDKALKKGLALYNKLIAFHREDGNVDALAMAELDAAEYIHSFDNLPEKTRDADYEAFLGNFLKRYEGKTDVAAIAAATKANRLRRGDSTLADIIEDDGEETLHRGDLVAAHALAAEYAAKWPKSPGGIMCAGIVADIESKKLSVKAERNWCAPWPEIAVKSRNVAEVHFRLVPVSFDELVEDTSMGVNASYASAGDAIRRKYLKRTPAKEWTEKVPLKADYSEQEFKFAVPPGLKAGHYVLYAAANGEFGADEQPLFARHVTVTSLALSLETGNGTFAGTVYRAESGMPVEGATVEMWWYGPKGGRIMKLREKYVTDSRGRFTADVAKGENGVLQRHVRAAKDGDEVLSLKSEGSGYRDCDEPNPNRMDVFTDRALYRPGQEIKVKGIAYHADPNTRDFHTLPDELVLVTLTDPNGKEVGSKRLRTNKWGSFTHAFTAPTGRLTGAYAVKARVVLKDGKAGETKKTVNVEEYKRPKFSVELDRASAAATLGAPMTVTGRALTYSGLPVQKAKVDWFVSRTTNYPDWWTWFGGRADDDGEGFVADGEAETDENGVFKVTFTPVASPKADLAGDPSFSFSVNVGVTDETGEEHSASDAYEVGTVAWRASVWTDGKWHTAAKPVPAKVSLRSLAGEPVPAKGRLRAFRLKAPERPVRKPAPRSRGYGGDDRNGPWNWKAWDVGEEVLSVEVDAEKGGPRAPSAPQRWEGDLNLGVGAYRLVFEASDPNGKTVKGVDSVLVFDPAADGLGMPVPDVFRVEKTTVKVGETLRAYWGTGYESGYCCVKVTNNGKVLLDTSVSGDNPKWCWEFDPTDVNRGEICIETTFVRENRIYHDHNTINVPWDNKYIYIKAEHMSNRLAPGVEETWKFKVSGPAEVLAFMYDKSLDAYKWHDVSLGFSSCFTPWTRWLGSPSLQNSTVELSMLCGRFPRAGRQGTGLVWPGWKGVDSFLERRRAMAIDVRGAACAAVAGSAGAGREVACCEDAVCAGSTESEIQEKRACNPRKEVQPRKNLQETAFFFPNLETDADGNVSFSFAAQDALTGWKFLMVAHDNALDGGIFRNDEIVTTKPLMCEPAAPRFVREGDDFLFAVKVTNTEDKPQNGEVSLAVEELGAAPRASRLPSPAPKSFSLAPHESKAFEFRLAIPDGCGFLKYVAKACGEKFADGEEGVLPVLSRRVMVREAVQLNARGKATKTFRLENLVASKGSDTIRHHDLAVRAVSRPAWYAVLSMPYLMEFPHECCEQTFSRYYANALGEHIANSDPRIRAAFDEWKASGGETFKSPLETDPQLKTIALESTPWVREAEHEGAARARLGELFGKNRLQEEQARCIRKLARERNGDGLWPWFPGGPSSDGITLYILTGFARLNHLAGLELPGFFADAVAALDREVAEDVQERLRNEKKLGIPFGVGGFDVRWLYLHSFKGVPAAKDKSLAPLFVKHLREEWTKFGLESQALAALALSRMGEGGLAKEIMASIKERGVVSEELGMYWKVPHFFSSSVFAAPVSAQATVVEAFREVAGDEESADACNVWLLKQKQTQDWTTTAATADAIYALLLGGGTDLLAGDALAEVTLGGEKVVPEKAEAGTGMYSVRYAADRIRPDMGEIAFTGAGEKGVSWGGVHWAYFEDVLKVRAHEPKELRVEKKYYKKVQGPGGTRLAKVEGRLEPGDEIVARLEITSDRAYEFVHLQDERPACAEPEDVLSSYRWRDGLGYYQSTRDTATHYYIDRLNKGTFVLETSYRVRQRGTFVGGLATIQCMYAPEFTAHSTAETVHVGEAR